MEELREGSLSGASRDDPATLAAWSQATSIQDKPVYDVNGIRLGKVSNAFAEDGALLRFDVTLTQNARTLFDATKDVASIPPHWVAKVDEDGVRLLKAAEQVLHPEAAGASENTGAKGLPRKVR